MTAATPGQHSFEPRLWWELKRKGVFLGPPAEPPAALLAALDQYAAAVQYADWF